MGITSKAVLVVALLFAAAAYLLLVEPRTSGVDRPVAHRQILAFPLQAPAPSEDSVNPDNATTRREQQPHRDEVRPRDAEQEQSESPSAPPTRQPSAATVMPLLLGGRRVAPPVPAASRPLLLDLSNLFTRYEIPVEVQSRVRTVSFLQTVFIAIAKADIEPKAEDNIPLMIIPLLYDGLECQEMLFGIDVGVKEFVFIRNSNNNEVRELIRMLRILPFGVHIVDRPDNAGFSGSINIGIQQGTASNASWVFAVNADTTFPAGALRRFAYYANRYASTFGLFYGPRLDHFAFGISMQAVRRVGLLDEVFWPGYMEDIDFRWRVRLSGLNQLITGAPFGHKQSTNLKKRSAAAHGLIQIVERAGKGLPYARLKWGEFEHSDIERDVPPSGWRTPFNIPNAPLSLWRVDPVHRECVRTGGGTDPSIAGRIKFLPDSPGICWYDASVLKEDLGQDAVLPLHLHYNG